MKKLLMGVAALPFCVGVAVAGQPLTNQQMDRVTAGYSAISVADAEGLVGSGAAVLTTTGSLSQVNPFATATVGEASITAYKSLAAAQSSTATTAIKTVPLGLSSPPVASR
jgi:hypothetical protein